MADRRGKEIDHDHPGQNQTNPDQRRNIQWLFENKEHNKAVQEIEKFFNQKNKANNSLINDFF